MSDVDEVFQIRDIHKEQWFWIDNEIIDDFAEKIGINALGVYLVFARSARSGKAETSLRRIAAKLSTSPQTVMRAAETLQKERLLYLEKKSSTPGEPSIYWLLQVPKRAPKTVPIGNGRGVESDNSVPPMERSVPPMELGVPPVEQYKDCNTRNTKSSASNKSKRENSASQQEPEDGRHGPIVQLYTALYMKANNCERSEVPWGPREAGRLARMLRMRKAIALKFFLGCIENRFKSDVNHADPPGEWMFNDKLVKYRNSPLNEFGKPKKGDTEPPPRNDRVREIQERARRAEEYDRQQKAEKAKHATA